MQAEITHRRVLAVALPIVLSNITVPLLGVVDTFAVGQIGDAASIAAEETWFVTDMHECMSQVEALFTARQMIYGKTPEVAQTVVQVVALVDPSFKIEIKCVAIAD